LVCGMGPSVAATDENGAVHLRRARDHVLDVVGVARAVDMRVVAVGGLVLHVRGGDGNAALALLGCVVDGVERAKLVRRLCFDRTLVIAAVSVVLPWSMCPIVPMFTCGFDRSNFSLPIAVSSLIGRAEPAVQIIRSVVGVQLEEFGPNVGGDFFQAGEVEFADLALVAVAEAAVLGGGWGAEDALAQDGLEVADAQAGAFDGLEKIFDPGRREGGFDGLPDCAEARGSATGITA